MCILCNNVYKVYFVQALMLLNIAAWIMWHIQANSGTNQQMETCEKYTSTQVYCPLQINQCTEHSNIFLVQVLSPETCKCEFSLPRTHNAVKKKIKIFYFITLEKVRFEPKLAQRNQTDSGVFSPTRGCGYNHRISIHQSQNIINNTLQTNIVYTGNYKELSQK